MQVLGVMRTCYIAPVLSISAAVANIESIYRLRTQAATKTIKRVTLPSASLSNAGDKTREL